MPLLKTLRPRLPILIGASLMLTFSMGLRQSLGIFMQPLTHDIVISVSEFTLAIAVQNLAWVLQQPLAGVWTVRDRSVRCCRRRSGRCSQRISAGGQG